MGHAPHKRSGVVALVTNGGFLDSNAADGMRKTPAEEFSKIHIFNLRGNQRTAGEQSRKEGGKIFDAGSRATVAITVLVKNPSATGQCTVRYTDIGDYLSREEKLRRVAQAADISRLDAVDVVTNDHGDWIGQRTTGFDVFSPLAQFFDLAGNGVNTGRDTWVCNSSSGEVLQRMSSTIEVYNTEVARWSSSRLACAEKLARYRRTRLARDIYDLCRSTHRRAVATTALGSQGMGRRRRRRSWW